MRKLLIALLAFSIPSAHATNYVECEAIRAAIIRNQIQMEKERVDTKAAFEVRKTREKYGKDISACYDLGWDTVEKKECDEWLKSVSSSDEARKYYKKYLDPLKKNEKRALKDYKKKGCF